MIKHWYRRLLELPARVSALPVVRRVLAWSKRRSLPGFFGVPVYDVLVFAYRESESDLVMRANSMAFSFFLALFPSLLALLSIVPTIQAVFLPAGPDLLQTLEREVLRVLPGPAGTVLFETINELNEQSPALFSVGTLFAFWFASNGVMSMMRGFEKTELKFYKRRKLLRKRLLALLLTLQSGAALLAAVILIIQLNLSIAYVAEYVRATGVLSALLSLAGWTVIFLLFYGIISSLYRFVPATTHRTGWLSPGATFATLGSILISVGFTLYVNNFDTYNKLYGSIGAVIATLLWLQFNSFVLLVGYELNAAIAVNRADQNPGTP